MRLMSKRRKFRSPRDVARRVTEAHDLRWRSSVSVLALDQLCAGVIVTDDGGRIIDMNRSAQSIVWLDDGLTVRNDRLCARRAFETAKMVKLIVNATADAKSGVGAGHMLVGRCDGLPPYVLTIARLRTNITVDDRRLALIIVVDRERHSPSEKKLAECFGLSPAEARLAAALLTGRTLSDIAIRAGVRITTVRTQLSAILKKVDAKRQSDLIRILSSAGIGSVTLAAGCLDIALEALQIPLLLAGT